MRHLITVCLLTLAIATVAGQSPERPFADESAGRDQIVRALVAVFDRADILALGEAHGRQADSDLRIALVRDPAFAKKVRAIVVEFGSTTEQDTLDRYVRGEAVSPAQLARVWQTTTQPGIAEGGTSRFYVEFFNAVRDVNAHLPADARIRVLGGDPGPTDHRSRETAAVSVLKEQVLQKHQKALVVYGAAHFYRTLPKGYLASMGTDTGLVRRLDAEFPGRTVVVIPVGGPAARLPGVTIAAPDYRKFDRALHTTTRPVLVPLQRVPFRDLSADEFLGPGLLSCQPPGGCRSAFTGSRITLGQVADAAVYFGSAVS
ncbi:MAG TPA: hypothetical protein VG871_03705 [Vicinamibacterales bacterium]|nr:hypothetical protein [Vicinamibacterales bacterium]